MFKRVLFGFAEGKPIKTFYMRKLPDIYVRLASEEGKTIFKEALEEGNMESYFPLAEQFITQLEPSTCGPTSLVMVLNSLGVDPMKRWKGGWRWYTEQNLNLMTKEILAKGLHLESWTHIARHNHLDVSTFYYPDPKIIEQRRGELRKPDCDCDSSLLLKTASFQTFRQCVLSSARREGLILTLNHSRKQMQQTGSGHYSPIGGFNRKRGLALMLDVARFKYPSYWCDIRQLYQSLSEIDTDSQLPRGFVLVSRKLSTRSEICNVGVDYATVRSLHHALHQLALEHPNRKTLDLQFAVRVLGMFDEPLRSTWVYFLFELDSYSFAEKQTLFSQIRAEEDFNVFENLIKETISNNRLNENSQQLKRLISEFEFERFSEVTYILFHSMPSSVLELPAPKSTAVQQRIRSFRRSFGLLSDLSREGEYF